MKTLRIENKPINLLTIPRIHFYLKSNINIRTNERLSGFLISDHNILMLMTNSFNQVSISI